MDERHARIEELANLLRLVQIRVWSQAAEGIREAGLSPPHMMVMHQLRRTPGLGVNELARRLSIAKSHISAVVNDLVERGWLERGEDPTDRRAVRLLPTARASAAFQRVRAAHLQALESLLSELPDDRLELALEGLRTLQAAIVGPGECPPGAPPRGTEGGGAS